MWLTGRLSRQKPAEEKEMNYGIPAHRIVAYTYDADYHCTECAAKAHGVDPNTGNVWENAEDSEGNEVHPVFSIDCDTETIASCGDCRQVICLVCGDVVMTRKRGAVSLTCWNCGTSAKVES
jgi:hypothetical protein